MLSTLRWNFLLIILWFCPLLCGCQRGKYDLDLSVDGAVLQRELRYQQSHGENETPPPVEPGEVRLLSAAYGVEAASVASSELVLNGEFTGATPADIGGAGALEHWHTPLGSAWVYVERFRGDDRPSATLAVRIAAANALVDALRDWFQVELQGSADRDRVVRFLDTDFRTDAHNLTQLAWTADAISEARGQDPNGDYEFAMRAGLYLIEHGYMTHRDLPHLDALHDEQQQLSFIRELLERRLDVDLSQPEWRFLDNRSAVERSLNSSLGLRAIEHSQDSGAGPVPASTWMADTLMRALGAPLAAGDRLTARLHLAQPPLRTNGQWQENEKCVVWERGLPLREAATPCALPTVLCAEWSSADAAFQQEHFGRTVLDRKPLFDFCVWSARLNAEQRGAWETFLATLTPGPDLAEQVQRFVFPPSKDEPSTVVRPPEMLIQALRAD